MIITSKGAISKIDESNISSKKRVPPPNPDKAPNQILKDLFGSKCLTQKDALQANEHTVKILHLLNEKFIDREQLQRVAFTGLSDEIKPQAVQGNLRLLEG
jgi:hypothetical protein